MSEEWNIDTVRAELDAIASLHGIGTFRSRYTLSAAELYALVHTHLRPHERILCQTVIAAHVSHKVRETDAACPDFLRER